MRLWKNRQTGPSNVPDKSWDLKMQESGLVQRESEGKVILNTQPGTPEKEGEEEERRKEIRN